MPSTAPRPSPPRALPVVLAALATATLATACGASEDPGIDPGTGATSTTVADGPRVADPRFDGEFVVTEVVLDGAAVTLAQRPSLEIETEFGSLTVNPGCNVGYGSFTLTEDGRASFTVTGGSTVACGDLAEQEAAVLEALDRVASWTSVDGGFRFDGPGASITVEGPTR